MSLNVKLLPLFGFKAASRFLILMPILIPFLESNGLSLSEILSLTGIYSIACAVFELPTGVLADRWGRKPSLILGAACYLLAYSAYALFTEYSVLMLGNILLGISASFFSGTDSAYLYDYLKANKASDKFNQMEGRMYAISTYSEATAGLAAAALAGLSMMWNVWAQVAAAAICLIFLIFLQESKHFKVQAIGFKQQVKVAKELFVKNRTFSFYMLLSSVLGVATLTLAWLSQAYFKEIGLALFWFGILWTCLNLLVGFGANLSYRFEKIFSLGRLSQTCAFTIAAAFICMWFSKDYWVIGIIAVASFARGIATPALRTLMHAELSSEIRASIFSVRSLLIRGLYGILAMGIAVLNSQQGLEYSLGMVGLLFLLAFTILSYFRWRATKAS